MKTIIEGCANTNLERSALGLDGDMRLTDSNEYFEKQQGLYKAKFCKRTHAGNLIEMDRNGCKLSLEPVGISDAICEYHNGDDHSMLDGICVQKDESFQGAKLLYDGIFADTDLEYKIEQQRVKENIIIKGRQESYIYQFVLKVDGLTATFDESEKTIKMYNAVGEYIFKIPAPVMYDANGAESNDVTYELLPVENGSYLLDVAAYSVWINAQSITARDLRTR